MKIIIYSRLVTNCKAKDVHSEHKSWVDGKKLHDYTKRLTDNAAVLEEHWRLEAYLRNLPPFPPGYGYKL